MTTLLQCMVDTLPVFQLCQPDTHSCSDSGVCIGFLAREKGGGMRGNSGGALYTVVRYKNAIPTSLF